MRSTGEVMGIDADFPLAFAKSQIAAGRCCRPSGNVFISVRNDDKEACHPDRPDSSPMTGFKLYRHRRNVSTSSNKHGIPATRINKLSEGRPNIHDLHQERQGSAHHQHADEQRPGDRRGEDSRDERAEPRADRDDDDGGQRGGEGDRGVEEKRVGSEGVARVRAFKMTNNETRMTKE